MIKLSSLTSNLTGEDQSFVFEQKTKKHKFQVGIRVDKAVLYSSSYLTDQNFSINICIQQFDEVSHDITI